jgi:PIN domain nuclease of toxin-antitoxin system
MLNLDTHMLVALITGDVSSAERACAVNQPLAISDIVLWELAMLVRKNRLQMDLDSAEFRAWVRHVAVLPITVEIARQSTLMDFSADPRMRLLLPRVWWRISLCLPATGGFESLASCLWHSSREDGVALSFRLAHADLQVGVHSSARNADLKVGIPCAINVG